MATFRIVGISFDHMHMGDLLRMFHDHPEAEIAGIFDPDKARMADAIAHAPHLPPPDRHDQDRQHLGVSSRRLTDCGRQVAAIWNRTLAKAEARATEF